MSEPRRNKLEGLTDGELADKFGDVKARGERAEDELTACKVEFDRRQLDFAKGARFKVTKDEQTQNRLDTKALRAALGDAAIKKFEKESTRTMYLVRALEGQPA